MKPRKSWNNLARGCVSGQLESGLQGHCRICFLILIPSCLVGFIFSHRSRAESSCRTLEFFISVLYLRLTGRGGADEWVGLGQVAILTLSTVPRTGPFTHHLACGGCHSYCVEWGDGFYGNYSVDDTTWICAMWIFLFNIYLFYFCLFIWYAGS